MMIRIRLGFSQRTLLQLLFTLLLSICGVFYIDNAHEHSAAFAALSCLQLLVNTFFLRKMKIRWFSFSMLFCWSTFIFHFGNVLLNAIGQSEYCVWDIIARSGSLRDYNVSCLYSLVCSGMVISGIMMAYTKNEEKYAPQATTHIHKRANRAILYFGILLFVVSVVPSVMLQWKRAQVVLVGGLYSQTRSVDNELGLLYWLTRFFPFSISMLLLAQQDKPFRARKIYIAAVVYEALCMISGNRSLQLIAIIMYTFIYVNVILHGKLKKRTIVLIAVLGYIGAAGINVLMRIRNFGLLNYDIGSLLTEVIRSNPLFALLGEFGNTQLTVSLAITNYPAATPFKAGMSYAAGLLSWFPPLFGRSSFQDAIVYIRGFSFGSHITLGGSYIGELYANFGWFGCIGALFVGVFIGKTCSRIFACLKSNDWIKLIPLLALFYFNLFWVRNYFYGFVFTYVGLVLYLKFAGDLIFRKTVDRRSEK